VGLNVTLTDNSDNPERNLTNDKGGRALSIPKTNQINKSHYGAADPEERHPWGAFNE